MCFLFDRWSCWSLTSSVPNPAGFCFLQLRILLASRLRAQIFIMDPKRKISDLNEKAVKAQKTTVEETAKPSSVHEQPSSSSDSDESDKLFWIEISNVNLIVAHEVIFQALFKGCLKVRSLAFESASASQFRGIVEVAFDRKEAVNEAINKYQHNIKLFEMTWTLKDLSNPDSPSSTETAISYPGNLSKTAQTIPVLLRTTGLKQPRPVGTAIKVIITEIDGRVPKEVVPALFETAGLEGAGGKPIGYVFNAAEEESHDNVEVVYGQLRDAVYAAAALRDKISFFSKTWQIGLGI